MEKKKMCPRLLDYLVVVGARYKPNLRAGGSLKCLISRGVTISSIKRTAEKKSGGNRTVSNFIGY